MPVIPRVSGPTVGFQPAMQPGSSGDGYAAPGRALQGLGQSIAGLGEAFGGMQDKDDEYNANLELVKWKNEQEISRIKGQNEFNGDPTGFAAGQVQLFDQSAADLRGRLPQNPKIQQRAALIVEQTRGNTNEAATQFEYGKRKEQTIANVGAAITSEFAVIDYSKPETIVQDLEKGILAANRIIDNGLMPEAAKEKLRNDASQMLQARIDRLPPEQRLQAAQKIIETIQSKAPAAPRADAGGASVSISKASGDHSFVTAGSGARLRVATTHADRFAGLVRDLEAAGVTIDAKQSGGFADRNIAGTNTKSRHSFGEAIDVNWSQNARGGPGQISKQVPPDKIREIAARNGLKWGGDWKNPDPMHFEVDRNLAAPAKFAPTVAAAPNVGLKTTLSAYSPQAAGSKMEGGYAASKPGPDGKAEVRTLEDVASGRSPYVTVAGNPSLAGKAYTIPEITFIGTDGKERTLKNVKAVVHDTGSAFKTAPEGRFDVPIGKDADDALMAKNAGLWSKSGVQFVPEGQGEQAAKSPPVAERGLTRVAGLKPAANDAGPQGSGSVAAAPLEKTKVVLTGTPEEKAAKLREVYGQGYNEVVHQLDQDGNDVLIAAQADKPGWYANTRGNGTDGSSRNQLEATDGKRAGPAWAQSVIDEYKSGKIQAKGSDGASYESDAFAAKKAAEAPAAAPPGRIRFASADSHVLENLTKRMDSYQAAYNQALEARLKTVDERAARGEVIPLAEADQLRGLMKDSPAFLAKLETTMVGAEITRAYKGSNPIAVEARIAQLRGQMNTAGASPALSTHVAALEKLKTSMDSELKKDPYAWGLEAGVLPPTKPLAPQTVLTEQGVALLEERVKQADHLAQTYGEGYRQYFTPTEKTALVAGLKQGGPQAIGILSQMRTGMGDKMPAAIAELLPNEPEMARAGFLAAFGGDPKGVEAIAATFARRQDPKYKTPKFAYGSSERIEAAKEILGDSLDGQANAIEFDRHMHAAEAIYEHLNKDGTDDKSETWKTAFKMAIGVRLDGRSVVYGGMHSTVPSRFGTDTGMIQIPSSIAQNKFEILRDGITKQHLAEAGLPLPANEEGPIALERLGSSKLVNAGYGKYFVVLKKVNGVDEYATSIGEDGKPDGKPYVLDLIRLEPVLRKQVPDAYFPTK